MRATNGAERILFENGSSIALLSSSWHAGHGDTLHMILADELWCASDLIEQLRPTLITTGGVFLGFSTAGTPGDSRYLLARVEQGRRDAEAGVTSGRAYFEWSIDPADIDDVEAYVAINPAVGRIVTADDIRNAVEGMPKVEAARSFGNIFTTAMHDPVIPLERWLELEDGDSQITSGLVFAVDVSPDRKHASIGAAGRRADDKWHVEVIESKEGVAWVPARLRALVTQHHPRGVYVDFMTESFIPELEASGVAVERLHAQAHASAFGFFVDAVAEGTLRHCADDELLQALTAANTRPLGDGGKAWSRRGSSVRIDGLGAITLALWGAQLQPPPIGIWSMTEEVPKVAIRLADEREQRRREQLRRFNEEAKKEKANARL